jgi:peptidyl-prolyl cis-trans isomerase A (cyclophilin A)
MKLKNTFLLPVLALAFASLIEASAQQSTKPATEEIPDAPQATAAALIVPNGPTAVIDTSMGRITCQFYQRQAPNAVANFIGLAEGTRDWIDPTTGKKQHHKPLYDGTTFHRVIPEFMIQGGDPIGTGTGDPGYKFDDEIDPNLNFDRPGRLAMANSGPNTNGSQFFVTEVPTDFLNGHYTLFGQCDAASVDVVKAISRVQRDSNDKPLTPVLLKKVTIVPEGQPLPPLPTAELNQSSSFQVAGIRALPQGGTASFPLPDKAPNAIVISPGIAERLLVSHTPPVYPSNARQAGVSGTVALDVTIGPEGAVQRITVVDGPAMLQGAALDAVKTWHYRPYLLNGQAFTVKTRVNVNFTLGG